jgi:hypothetical protein
VGIATDDPDQERFDCAMGASQDTDIVFGNWRDDQFNVFTDENRIEPIQSTDIDVHAAVDLEVHVGVILPDKSSSKLPNQDPQPPLALHDDPPR